MDLLGGTLVKYFDIASYGIDIISSKSSGGSACSRWNDVLNTMTSKSVGSDIRAMTAYLISSVDVGLGDSYNVSCRDAAAVKLLSERLQTSVYLVGQVSWTPVPCMVEVGPERIVVASNWSVGHCGTASYLKIEISGSAPFATTILQFSPCNSTYNLNYAGGTIVKQAVRGLSMTYAVQFPAPDIRRMVVFPSKNTIDVSATLDEDGLVYCAAFLLKDYAGLSSIDVILSSGFSAWSTNYVSNVTITGLIASSSYYVLCLASSLQGASSSLETVVNNNNVSVTTTCCLDVVVTITVGKVLAKTTVLNAVSVRLSALPSNPLTFTATLTNGYSSFASLSPSIFVVSSRSPSSMMFALLPVEAVGTYNVSIVLSGLDSLKYATSFPLGNAIVVYSSGQIQPAPHISTAAFSSDGSNITVTFTSATNGGLLGITPFACSRGFNFTGATAAQCQWKSDLSALVIKPAFYTALQVGDLITLLPDFVKSACPSGTNCSSWLFSAISTVPITAPASAATPFILLTGPSAVGVCSNWTLDASGSRGSGGRKWLVGTIRIDSSSNSSNLSRLRSYLNSAQVLHSLLTVMRVIVPYQYLDPESIYSVNVKLCNFLGYCGQGRIALIVTASAMPSVSIGSPPQRMQYTNQPLSFRALAYTYGCDGSTSSANLHFAWSLTARSQQNRLQVVSSATPFFALGAFILQPLNTYDVTVTARNIASGLLSSATVSVTILRGKVIAAVSGSSYRSVRVSEGIEMDGSGSYDTDQAGFGNADMLFDWQWYQLSPVYLSSCGATRSYSNDVHSILKLRGSNNATNSTCLVTLDVSLDIRYDHRSVTIYFISSSDAVARVLTSQSSLSHVNAASKVSIQASVLAGELPTLCAWSVNDPTVSLAKVALTATTTYVAGRTNASYVVPVAFNLVFGNAQLSSGAEYTLTLTCVAVGSAASTASITLSTNGNPVAGSFIVKPATGVALSTQFTLSALAWADDGDYPLTYEYGFISPLDGRYIVTSSRALTATAYTALPAGLRSLGYLLSCQLAVFDVMGAVSYDRSIMWVNESQANVSFISRQLAAGLASAGMDTDAMKAVIMSTAVTINAVSCTLAPNCTSLNRLECSSVSNTCGACSNEDFVGAQSSNDPCIPITSLSGTANASLIDCAVDADCPNSWFRCSTEKTALCFSPIKNCSSECSRRGSCVFRDTISGSGRSTCTIADPSCVAECYCDEGFYGDTCELTAADVQSMQTLNAQLITALQQEIMMESELVSTSDSSSVAAWSSGMAALTSMPLQVNAGASEVSVEAVKFILSTQSAQGFTMDTVSALLTALDNCAAATGYESVASTSSRRRLESTGDIADSLLSMAEGYLSEMVAGEVGTSVVLDAFRMRSEIAVVPNNTASKITIRGPQTTLEAASGGETSSVTIYGESNNASKIAVLSLKSSLFSSVESEALGTSLTNPMMFAMTAINCSLPVYFSFRNSYVVNMSRLSSNPNLTYATECKVRERRIENYTCPYGSNISHICTGDGDYSLSTRCAVQTTVPSCSLARSDDRLANCSVSYFDADSITCACSFCGDVQKPDSRTRLLGAVGGGRYSGEIAGLLTYISADFETITVAAENISVSTLKHASVVLVTFGILWVTLFVAVGMVELSGVVDKFSGYSKKLELHVGYAGNKRATTFFPVQPAAGSDHRLDESKITLTQAKKYMKAYVFTFFPNVFSEKPNVIKFWHEIVHKHRYFALLAREKGYKKFVGCLEILSLLTAHMFLIAVLYDAEWPNDDGFCITCLDSEGCLKRTSVFDSSRPMCKWTPSSSSSSNSSTGNCAWVEPVFDPTMQILITMIVIAFSGPINALVNVMINLVLLAPSSTSSAEEAAERDKVIHVRRASAIGALGHYSPPPTQPRENKVYPLPNVDHGSTNASPLMASSGVATSTSTSWRKSVRQRIRTVAKLDDSLTSYCVDDHSMRTQLGSLLQTPEHDYHHQHPVHTTDFTGEASVMQELPTIGKVLTFVQQLRNHSKTAISSRDKNRLKAQWSVVLEGRDRDDSSSYEECILQLTHEMQQVNAEASKLIKQLKLLPSALVGVKILELFVLDLLGRDSRQAKIFARQRSALHERILTSVYVKICVICLLVGLDAYFIFMCLLYGDIKGREWQVNWAISCGVYILVDIFIKHVNIVFLIYYFIPVCMIENHTKVMKLRFMQAIDALVVNSFKVRTRKQPHPHPHPHPDEAAGQVQQLVVAGEVQQHTGYPRQTAISISRQQFSVTDYLFVSTLVAEAFPQLLESWIVLSYRSIAVSEYQARKLRMKVDENHSSAGYLEELLRLRRQRSFTINTIVSVVSVSVMNLLITLGCQSLLIQKIVVQIVDPLVMGAIAFIGSTIIHSSLLGVPLVVATIIVMMGLFGYWSFYRRTKLTLVRAVPAASVADQSRRRDTFDEEDKVIPSSSEGDESKSTNSSLNEDEPAVVEAVKDGGEDNGQMLDKEEQEKDVAGDDNEEEEDYSIDEDEDKEVYLASSILPNNAFSSGLHHAFNSAGRSRVNGAAVVLYSTQELSVDEAINAHVGSPWNGAGNMESIDEEMGNSTGAFVSIMVDVPGMESFSDFRGRSVVGSKNSLPILQSQSMNERPIDIDSCIDAGDKGHDGEDGGSVVIREDMVDEADIVHQRLREFLADGSDQSSVSTSGSTDDDAVLMRPAQTVHEILFADFSDDGDAEDDDDYEEHDDC
jgi:hypothetical protein